MVRCRSGNFQYNDSDMALMEAQVDIARECGAHGLVFGALDGSGTIDVRAVSRILDCAGDLEVTFHRAFDHVANSHESLETLIDLGVRRVLTSGGAPTAWEGRESLRDLVRHADGRIIVMAGGGVRRGNVQQLVAFTGVSEVHSSVPFTL